MRIALLQINPTAGDISGNSALIIRGARTAQSQAADLVVTPELALMGYLPRDLLMSRGFVKRSGEALARIAVETQERAGAAGGGGHSQCERHRAAAVQQRGAAAERIGGAGLS